MQTVRFILRRRPVAASPAPMHCLPPPLRRLLSTASPLARWWLVRRVFPLVMQTPHPLACRASQFPHRARSTATIRRVQGNESGQPYRRMSTSSFSQGEEEEHSAVTQGISSNNSMTYSSRKMRNIDTRGDISTNDRTAEVVLTDEAQAVLNKVYPESSHRDGSIYNRGMDIWWKKEYRIADRDETQLEPEACILHNGTCLNHDPCWLLQFFSIELAKVPVDGGGSVELYGYLAARDNLDPRLNYIVNISRDDPVVVQQGSRIKMDGPKRGIINMDFTLLEFDMRIKTGEQEKDDLSLIDGASTICYADGGLCPRPFEYQITGDHGVVDLNVGVLFNAVEATVEVLISEVRSGFHLSLGCFTSGLDEEIRFFDGAIAEPRGLKRHVVAVVLDALMDLKFRVAAPSSSSSDQHCCSFKARVHGHDTQEIRTDFALLSVKVTWSTL